MAPSFNDRRGTNPFQAVVSTAPRRAMADFTHPHSIDSYIGRGTTTANGALPPKVINGRTFTRDNPDVVSLKRRQIEIGERSAY